MGLRITRGGQSKSTPVSDRDLWLVGGKIVEKLPKGVGAVVVAKAGRPIPAHVVAAFPEVRDLVSKAAPSGDVLDGKVKDVVSALDGIPVAEAILLHEAETAGKGRKGVLEALEAIIAGEEDTE